MPPPDKKNLHQVVDDLLERHASRVALEQSGARCTYAELDRRSAALAGLLREHGVGRGDVVALPMRASIDYVTAVLGVVRAGAIFMPVDPAFPPARLARMLELAPPRAAIGDPDMLASIRRLAPECAGLTPDDAAARPADRPPVIAGNDDTGYLIATSGSTGEPKLIAGRNKGISHFVHWEMGEFGVGPEVRASFLAPPTFDVSLREIFVPLLAGGTLVIPSPQVRGDARLLAHWLCEERITLLHCVPSLLRLLTRALRDEPQGPRPLSLACIGIAGEPLYGADVAAWREAAGDGARLYNLYGPSETTLAKAFHRIDETPPPRSVVPLGRAIANTALHVIRDGRLCATGETGELHIQTPFASNGYWGRPAWTAEAFVANPLAPDSPQRLYRTGDLARLRDDGVVEFVGRADRQVKIAGVRVELPEVELAMRAHAAVTEAVAQAVRLADGEQALVGYYTADPALAPAQLREAMRSLLPDAMLPGWLVPLDAFPRNLNGKVDRRALPRPQELLEREHGYVAPEGEVEQAIAALWAEALGLPRVGATSPYLELGGNSMRAIGLIGRIGQRFGVALNIRDFFAAGTVRALARQVAGARPAAADAIARAPERPEYPLTDAQAGLWLLDRIDGASALYNNVEWLELRGPLDADALEAAFGQLMQRHESLRTAFIEIDGEPRQRILPGRTFVLDREDCAEADSPERLRALLLAERGHRFNLAAGELLRARLLRCGAERHHLLVNMHHIACDGWSMAQLVRELLAGYRGETPAPEGEALRMRDLATWLHAQPEDGARREAWQRRLADAHQRAALPPDPAGAGREGDPWRAGQVAWKLAGARLEALRAQLAGQDATLFMGVAAALTVLLYRHGASETVVFGTPLAGRSRPELRRTVGFLVNTLPVVLRPVPQLAFGELLARCRQSVEDLAAGEFDTPLRWAAAPGTALDPARNPFYDVVLAQEPAQAAPALPGLALIEHEVPGAPARNDLSFVLREEADTLTVQLAYRSTLYDAGRMQAVLEQLGRLLEAGAAQPTLPIARLRMLDADEAQRLRALARGPTRPLPRMRIDQAFAARAAATPDAPALVGEGGTVSCRALDARANAIALRLREAGVQAGDVVGVLLQREPDWPAAILGVFKAGAVYLPLDPWHPPARHAALLEDAGAAMLIARGTAIAPCAVLDLATVAGGADAPPPLALGPEAPAYLIYTSGSTGTPKGVLVAHGAFLNMIDDQIAALQVGAEDTWLQLLSPAFDVSLFEVFLALLSPGRLALADRRACTTPEGLLAALARWRVTMMGATPGFLNSLGTQPLAGLRMLLVGGETPIAADLQRRLDAGIRIVHAYGPTEAAVCAAFEILAPGRPVPQPLPLGRPTANCSLHVVAPDLSLLPAGATGELVIGGAGLALGYHRRPADTEAAFVADVETGERVYRTGDRVRRQADGSLVFVGRKDGQAKIRGHRVEPGEVEAALRQLAGVADARVVVRAIGADQELAAYWVGDAQAAAGLAQALARSLPEYMVPRVLQRLGTLPLTLNGKLDVTRLPRADASPASAAAAPEGDDERALAALWSELLGCGPVGRDADFFALGGRSLAANRLALRAARALGVPVALRDIYLAPTPAALAARLRTSGASTGATLPQLPQDRPAPLSPMQERLWVIDQLGDSGPAYHITSLQRLRGPLRADALRAAFADLAARHAVLRTRIVADGSGTPWQVCDPAGPVPWSDVSGDAAAIEARMTECANQPFALARDWPLRVALARQGEDDWQLLIVLHHIAADGWSMGLLEADLATAYAARCRGAAPTWAPLPAQYRDIAAWMQAQLASGAHAADRDYWLAQLVGPLPQLALPVDRPRPAVRRFEGATHTHALDPATVAAAEACARAAGCSLFAVLLATLQLLLQRLSGQDELVIGTPVAGRPHPASEGLVGFFVNTLPLRTRIAGTHSFADHLAASAAQLREGLQHQGYPFDRLVADLRLARDTSRSALVDVMIGLDEATAGAGLQDLVAEPLPLARAGSRCDLTWLFSAGAATLQLEYDSALFDRSRVADWARRFEQLLRTAAADAAQPIAQLDLLLPGEREALLHEAAAPDSEPPAATVLEMFGQQVRTQPQGVAVRADAGRWTYLEIDRAANALAQAVQPLRSRPEAPVALLCGRGPGMVVAQLAVLKCGAAYLPIEPDAPAARARLLLEDSGAEVLLYEAALTPAWLAEAPVRHALPLGEPGTWPQAQTPPQVAAPGPDDPIYVMYTSGSTGRPKGVLAPHRGVARLVQGGLYYTPEPGDRVLQLSNYAFDGATFDFYAALANGLPLCIPDAALLLDPPGLADFVRRHEVNVAFVTTALFNRLVDEAPGMLQVLRRLYFGGQECSLPHVRRALALMRPGALVHVYGPTECTTFASWHTVQPQDAQDDVARLPIGRPVGHTTLYVLDAQQRLVPPGLPGELCIGGAGVALGYLGQPERTAEAFIASPFARGEVLYRTGDLCRRRADGAIEFLGRIDGQVKVRGFRVEPGEVEHQLARHPAIAKLHVAPWRNQAGNVELAAYYTVQPGHAAPTAAQLVAHMEALVPRYMVPAHFVALEQLPLNRNGKVDRDALPAPAQQDAYATDEPVPGLSPSGQALHAVWCEVLGRAAIAPDDNYYALGGDSIQAIQIGSRLRARGYTLKVTDLLRHPTIAQLAPLLARADGPRAEPAAPEGAPAPLVPVQHWFLQLGLERPEHFNQSVLLRLPAGTDPARVQRILRALEQRHAALRLRLVRDDAGQPWQRVLPAREAGPDLQPVDIASHAQLREAIDDLQRSLSPVDGPVWRAALYRLADGDRLFLTVHHWAVDGVSWRILLEDLRRAWSQNGAIDLPPATDPPTHWAHGLAQAAASDRFLAQRDYWQAQLYAPVGRLPVRPDAAPRPAPLGQRLRLELVLDAAASDALFGACHAAYRTRSDELLVAAWVRALTQVQGHPACRVLLEGHGRDGLAGVDVSRTVGWFTALYPLTFTLQGDGWAGHIRQVKETLRAVPDHGLGFGALRHLAQPPLEGPLPESAFNYLGRFDEPAGDAGPLAIADESTGDELDPGTRLPQGLDLGAELRDGRLHVRLVGDTGRHPEACFHALQGALAQALQEVVAHCLQADAGALSPSDVDLPGVSLDDLDRILDGLEQR
jgi:amino acid adenylation domain-containing protein/non-ribosomal peptide synthase protein (TIGR01720 family)